ncbi:MAG: hypothetical protein AAGB12_15735 [Pseudomonadota bacterium]
MLKAIEEATDMPMITDDQIEVSDYAVNLGYRLENITDFDDNVMPKKPFT